MHLASLLTAAGIVSAAAAVLPIEQESLGAWNYVLPLQSYPSGQPFWQRPISAPTAIEFGEGRIAVIVPGSMKIAEFKEGSFEELALPKFAIPSSLGVDRGGKLYCLIQRQDRLRVKDGWRERWIVSWSDSTGWSEPLQAPFPDVDRIEFDSQNRLWAMGPARKVAVLKSERWDQYTYSDDSRLAFAPMRMATGENGDVILFSNVLKFGEVSRLPGALIYREGKFIKDPKWDVAALIKEQQRKDAALANDDFERRTGYICHSAALNMQHYGPTTVLRTKDYVIVSFNNLGLAWAGAEALRTAPALDEAAEWEKIDDVVVPPEVDAEGALWLVRDNPRRLVKIGIDASQEFPLPSLKANPERSVLEFDQLGRPWIQSGSVEEEIVLWKDGELHSYHSEMEALRAETKEFKAGNIFPTNPLAVKTNKGALCLLDYSTLKISDVLGVHSFSDEQISPGHTRRIVMPRHGYNPFREGEPKFDDEGNIYTRIDGEPFQYRKGHWRSIQIPDKDWAKLQPPESPLPGDSVPEAFETVLLTKNGPEFVFRRLHFYKLSANGQREPIDHGVNPLAYYPFWSTWYDSPGLTKPRVDSSGRLWISPLGPYAGNRIWMVLKKQ